MECVRLLQRQQRKRHPRQGLEIMNDITLTDEGTALDHASGFEYDIHSFDMDGHEAITIPALDLISYDEGDNWQTIE